MSSQDRFNPLVERTEAKLRYAKVQLEHLKEYGGNGGTDFDRAFHESILFHLLGAKDAFLQEINAYYKVGLAPSGVTLGALRQALMREGRQSGELRELYELESNGDSWLSHAKQMRDYATHISGVPRAFHMGGPNHGKVFLRNLSTLEHVEMHATDALAAWLENMRSLVARFRESARSANAL